jgi:hypothetical protein
MSVRFIQNPNALGQKISSPGGNKISDAVSDAQAAVDGMAPAGLEALDRAIADIGATLGGYADAAGALPVDMLETIYRQAADIHAAAAVFGLADLGEAGWSLCELIDTGGGGQRSGQAAVASHLHSLRILRHGESIPADQRRALLQGLQDLRLHSKAET